MCPQGTGSGTMKATPRDSEFFLIFLSFCAEKGSKYLIFKKRLVKDLSEYTSNPPVHAKAAMKLAEAGLKIPREIQYVMTQKGPAPIELMTEDIDYNFYLERQIKPLAQPVYDFLGKSFEDIWAGDQMQLF